MVSCPHARRVLLCDDEVEVWWCSDCGSIRKSWMMWDGSGERVEWIGPANAMDGCCGVVESVFVPYKSDLEAE